MRGKFKTCFRAGNSLTDVEGNASVHQVNIVCRTTGEGRAKFFQGPDGLGMIKRERGGGGRWSGSLIWGWKLLTFPGD